MSRRNKTRTNDQVAESVAVNDAFSNPLFRLGYGSQAPLEATNYPLTRMTDNYAMLNSLYRDNWVVQNVVEIIPGDMLREWFTLTGDVDPERMAAFERIVRNSQLRDRLFNGLCWGRLYGGAAGLILIDGQEDLSEPLDVDAIMPNSYQGLYILDRWSGITPGIDLVSDPADVDFNLPMWYDVTNARGETVARVHHSRIVRFTGRELPFLEKVAEMYWGESEIEALYDDVRKHDNVSHNMANLTFRANLDVMTVQNLDQLLSLGGTAQQKRFWDVMQAQSVIKSNFGMQLINRDDKIQNFQYTFSGLKEIYDSMCLDLSGASHIPVTKLFGRSPAGMNATGESDLKNYYDYVDTLRESKLRPALERLLPVMLMSAWGEIPDDVDIQFPPLWTPTAKEVSEIARSKAETIISVFQAGLMDKSAAMKELKKLSDETGLFDSIADEEIEASTGLTYQDVTEMKDPLAGIEMGGEESVPFDEVSSFDSMTVDGGKGSGNFGHAGRPGQVGGSASSGGGGSSEATRSAFEKAKEKYDPFDGYSSTVEEEMPEICYSNNVKTPLEKAAIKAYTTNSDDKEINYKTINGYLNGTYHPDEATKEKLDSTISEIDKCIQTPTTKNLLLYRGQNIPASDFSVGMVIKNKGFTSTSVNKDIAQEFATENNGCVLHIKVPSGTKALFVGGGSSYETDEGEMLFGRGVSVTITKVEGDYVEGVLSYGD